MVLRAREEISGMVWLSGAPWVTGPAGRLVDAMAAVREVAGSGVVTAAALSVAEFVGAGAEAALDFTGVRSLAGVEAGVALAGG